MPVSRHSRFPRRPLLLLTPWLVCLCRSALAASDTDELSTIIVTSPPSALGAEVFSSAYLSGDELANADRLDVALSQVPGASLFRRDSSLSANPTTQGIGLRSIAPSGAGRALVLLDGVPLNDPFGNWVIWSALPTAAISDAEVVRGAGAGPYGSGSLTGVIALTEQSTLGLRALDVQAGELGQRRASVAGGHALGELNLFGSASVQQSDGWIPVASSQRGAADTPVTLSASSVSLRGEFEPVDGTAVSVRVAAYNEHRDSGLQRASSSAKGKLVSVAAAHPERDQELGWRLQTWWRETDFTNSSVTVATGRASTTPSNDQYATPATGWGANAAVRGKSSWSSLNGLSWEVGGDVRVANGESREYLTFTAGDFTQQRVAGGKTLIGGVYVETAVDSGPWLATAGVRVDQWRSSEGHLVQRTRSTGIIGQEQYPASQSGTVPTARAGLRYNFADGMYFRSAAYSGFRTPSLNELYRPFRLGNNITQANAALKPERLYGAEVGTGFKTGNWSWDLTLFKNDLRQAITNVTIAQGPGNFPGVGVVPAGGLLIQRQNAGDIDAKGLETELRWRPSSLLSLRVALDWVDAKVNGGTQAPQLTGLRPAQAPRSTVTTGVVLTPFAHWTGTLDYRRESLRYADDLNTLRLESAGALDVQVSWSLSPRWSVYAALNNAFDARIATTRTADDILSYAAPRYAVLGVRVGR